MGKVENKRSQTLCRPIQREKEREEIGIRWRKGDQKKEQKLQSKEMEMGK